jgi:cytoskeletal protein CcmA (bactofilin family)
MAIEYYSSIDLNKNELQNAVVQNLSSAPGSPVEGQIYYDTGDDVIYFRNASAWVSIGGDITSVVAGAGMTGGGTTGDVTLNVIGGDGITANANDVAITATQTTITSILNNALVIGRDATDQIKFSTNNEIIFRVNGGDGVTFKGSGEIEATSLDISGDIDIDGTANLDAVDIDGDVDIAGTLTIASDIIHTGDTNNKIGFGTDTQTFTTGGTARLTITDATSTISNNLIVSGDLTVSGDTISANVGTLNVEDKNITLNQSSSDSSSTADGAGITIQDAVNADTDATLLWNAASDKFVFSHLIEAPGTSIFTNLDISGDVDVDGTLETDALTIGGAAVLAQATASAVGAVELATSAETQTGTDTARAVTPDGLAARSVVADIDVSSLTDANIVTITHNLGTADILVQVYDKTTEANIMCDIARTTDDFSTASTSVVSIDFGTAPPNDCRALITSLKGATASGTVAYT